MKNIDILRLSWKNLIGNKMRTLLTVLGIAIGIAAIVFLVSIGYGLQELSIRRISSISSLTALDVSPASSSTVVNNNLLKDISNIPNVEKTSPLLSLPGQVINQENKADIVAYGVGNDYFGLQGLRINVGGIFGDDGTQVVISSAVTKALNSSQDDLIGKEVIFLGYFAKENSTEFDKKELKYKIVGIINDDSSAFIYLPLSSLKEFVSDTTTYNSFKVKVDNQQNLSTVKSALESKGFKVTSVAETIGQVYQFFKYIQIILASFGIIALLVASIGMFNTMTIALLERTRDIGIMKAVGVQNSTVNKMFITESFLISFFGGIVGIFIGIGTSKIVNIIINALAKSVGGQAEKLFSTPITIVLAIVIFSVIVGITTGFYPAYRAGKLNPLDALRYE